MFRSYIRVALRNLVKNKLYAAVNIIGLSVAIAGCVVAYVNYDVSHSFNTFHENLDNLYTVQSYKTVNQRQNWAYTPLPMAEAMRNSIPGIKHLTRLSRTDASIRYGDQVFNESINFADPDFFKMLSFELTQGTTEKLADKNSIYLSEELALKYFGDEAPLGKQISVIVNNEDVFDYVVAGVLKNIPTNSSLQIDALVNTENLSALRDFVLDDWAYFSRGLLVETDPNVSPNEVEAQLQQYVAISNESNSDWLIDGFYLESFAQTPFTSRETRGDLFYSGLHPSQIITPSIIAVLVLLLACFNYVNTAIAYAGTRLKEIGVRKVIGGIRAQLIWQYMTENLVVCILALIFGVVLSEIFVPAYNSLWSEYEFDLKFSQNPGIILFLCSVLFSTGILAGAYPAFYISKFRPANIFRGKLKFGGTTRLIRVLMTFQFTLSIALIICGLVFTRNIDFIKNVDLGYARKNIYILPVRGEGNYAAFKNILATNPNIKTIAGSRHLVGSSWWNTKVESGELKSEVNMFSFGENYFDVAALELLQGRELDWLRQSDLDQSLLVNEKLMNTFKWKTHEGKFLKIKKDDSVLEYAVVGVVKDFNHNGVWRKIEPAAIGLTSEEEYRYLAVTLSNVDLPSTILSIENEWRKTFPNIPYDGFFMDDLGSLQGAIMVSESIGTLFLYISLQAVLIAGMGLFAMVSLNIAKRTKEISIRKILGASISGIGGLITREFIVVLSVAASLACIASYYLIGGLMGSIFAYHVGFSPTAYFFGIAIMLGIALLTVSTQVYKVANLNPALTLKDE